MFRIVMFSLAAMALHVTMAFGQAGCSAHMTCTNPVPATDISYQPFTNVWTDTYSETWTVTSTGNSISGSVVVPFPPGCPNVTFTVSGSISPSVQTDGTQGTTGFTFTGSNPSPSTPCGGVTPSPATFTGTIQNDGNDIAPGTSWTTVAGGSGTTTMTKSPSDMPASETTTAVGFGTGLYATVGQFRPTLNATSVSTDIFKGRQVSEYTGVSGTYDSCWFMGSLVPKSTSVTGSEWNVGYYAVSPPAITSLNTWVDDYVGLPSNSVTYYQGQWAGGGAPLCGARVAQSMYIATGGTSGSIQNYANDLIGIDIYSDHVTVYRAGVSQSANWP